MIAMTTQAASGLGRTWCTAASPSRCSGTPCARCCGTRRRTRPDRAGSLTCRSSSCVAASRSPPPAATLAMYYLRVSQRSGARRGRPDRVCRGREARARGEAPTTDPDARARARPPAEPAQFWVGALFAASTRLPSASSLGQSTVISPITDMKTPGIRAVGEFQHDPGSTWRAPQRPWELGPAWRRSAPQHRLEQLTDGITEPLRLPVWSFESGRATQLRRANG